MRFWPRRPCVAVRTPPPRAQVPRHCRPIGNGHPATRRLAVGPIGPEVGSRPARPSHFVHQLVKPSCNWREVADEVCAAARLELATSRSEVSFFLSSIGQVALDEVDPAPQDYVSRHCELKVRSIRGMNSPSGLLNFALT